MSSYGIETYRPDGSAMMNGLTRGGVFIEIIDLPAATSGTKSYPRTSGASLYFYTAVPGRHTVSVGTDANGAGCITWTNTGDTNYGNTRIFVFARKLIATDTYGIVVINNVGEALADQGYPNPQYLGKVVPNATATATYSTVDGYTAHVHDTDYFTFQDASDKFVLIAMPDSGTNDTWYNVHNECILANVGPAFIRIVAYTKGSSYTVPSLHIYAVNNPSPSSSTYGIQLHDGSGKLTYDSSMESVSSSDVLSIDYPSYGTTNTYSLAVTNMPGLSIPYFYRSGSAMSGANNTDSRYVGVAKKVGSQITFGTIMEVQTVSQNPYADPYNLGSQTGRYCPVVDLSKLAPSASTGVSGGASWTAPVFTTQPQAQRVTPGSTATFTVAVSGNPGPTVQWYITPYGGSTSAISGATYTTYSRVATAPDDNAQVFCIATNALTSTQSNSVTLRATNNTVPVITGTSGNQTGATGTRVTVTMSASGTPTPTCTISGSAGSASGSGSASFSFTPASAGTYSFTLTASNSEGSATSNVTITVSDPPGFATNPQSQSVTNGTNVTFTVTLSGSTQNTSFQWYRVPSGGSAASIIGATAPSYSFVCSLSNNGDQYYCVASNNVGSSQSTKATLTVTQANTAPSFSSGPTARNIDQGGTTTLSCSAAGYPAPSVTWSVGGTTVGTGSSCTYTPSGTGTVTVTCALSNAAGTASATVKFFIFSNFSVSVSPASTSTTSGSSVTLTATFPGANNPVHVVWSGPNSYSNIQDNIAYSGSSTVNITASSSTVGTYTATVTYDVAATANDTNNGAGVGSSQSHAASASISMTTPPTISQQPSSVSVTQNGTASFSVTASPSTSYQWYRGGSAISGATGSSVSADTSTVGSFSYYCIVYNGAAATQSSTATLTVNAPAQATYPSYNSFSATQYASDTVYEFDIYRGGTTSLSNWANGSGDGTLYRVSASGNFTPAYGSFALNTSYDFATYGGVNWNVPIPPPGTNNTSSSATYTLTVTVYLKSSGAAVASGTITVHASNSGTA